MQIITLLIFDGKAEAMNHCMSLFKDSKLTIVLYNSDDPHPLESNPWIVYLRSL